MYMPAGAETFKIKWINDVHHADRKVSGALCQCENISSANFLSLGIGVNVNSSPVPGVSVCLKDIAMSEKDFSVSEFMNRLSERVMTRFMQADKNGFEEDLLESV